VLRGVVVGVGAGHVVLDGDPAPHTRKGHSPIQFSAHVYCGQTAVWMKTPLGTEEDLGPGRIVLDGDPATPAKGAQQLPSFQPMSILATAELLSGRTLTSPEEYDRAVHVRRRCGLS